MSENFMDLLKEWLDRREINKHCRLLDFDAAFDNNNRLEEIEAELNARMRGELPK